MHFKGISGHTSKKEADMKKSIKNSNQKIPPLVWMNNVPDKKLQDLMDEAIQDYLNLVSNILGKKLTKKETSEIINSNWHEILTIWVSKIRHQK